MTARKSPWRNWYQGVRSPHLPRGHNAILDETDSWCGCFSCSFVRRIARSRAYCPERAQSASRVGVEAVDRPKMRKYLGKASPGGSSRYACASLAPRKKALRRSVKGGSPTRAPRRRPRRRTHRPAEERPRCRLEASPCSPRRAERRLPRRSSSAVRRDMPPRPMSARPTSATDTRMS